MIAGFTCQECGQAAPKRGFYQKYCRECSEVKSRKRARSTAHATRPERKSAIIQKGIETSKKAARVLLTDRELFSAEWGWMASFKVPFSQAVSKNHIWSMSGHGGHVFKRQESRSYQNLIACKVREATRDIKVFQNKLWIDLFVQKRNHKGDAVNVVDSICDGLKVGLDLDDRWFSIRQVDWEIAKHNPQIFITVMQRDLYDVQACSHCGRLLTLDNFGKKSNAKLGVDRACIDCRGFNRRKIIKPAAEDAWKPIGSAVDDLIANLEAKRNRGNAP